MTEFSEDTEKVIVVRRISIIDCTICSVY
jgi:hypothetical protein